MLSIRLPEIFLIAAVLSFVAVAGWFSWKAKPLGDKPYRYATYLAITSAAFELFNPGVEAVRALSSGNVTSAMLPAFAAILGVAACVGLLRRQKIGVVALALEYVVDFGRGYSNETIIGHLSWILVLVAGSYESGVTSL